MGLLSDSPLRRTAEDVVWCYDTNVKVPDHLVGAGWINASEVVLDKGADIVRIRALDDDGKARVDGLLESPNGAAAGRLLTRRLGVVSVNTKRGDILKAWLSRVSLEQRDAAYWLALRILADTTGLPLSDYYAAARAFFGASAELEEVTDDAGTSKSQEA